MQISDYLSELTLQLRLLDVPGDRIGAILAEAESHLAESGEEPYTAFGDPQAYARELAHHEGLRIPHRARRSANFFVQFLAGLTPGIIAFAVAMFVLTLAAGTLLATGILGLIQHTTAAFGIPAWLAIMVGAIAIALFALSLRRFADPLIDPRRPAARNSTDK